MFFQLKKTVIGLFAVALIVGGIFGHYHPATATVVYNQDTGLYTDDFADGSGIAASTDTGVNGGAVQLKNAGGTFAAPYVASGTVTIQLLRPVPLAAWGTVNVVATTPPQTSVKVQALDDNGTAFKNIYLSGNETGISAFPVDMSNVPVRQCADLYSPGDPLPFYYNCTRPGAIYLRFTLASTDPNVTPAIDSMSFSWAPTRGDLSASPSSTAPWPSTFGGITGANRSGYYNHSTYPAFRWAGTPTIGSTQFHPFLDLNDKLIVGLGFDYLMALSKTNGSEIWKLPSLYNFQFAAVSQNGTYYTAEINDDYIYAIDTATGQVKWSYYFGGGHGNQSATIGSDGLIYTIRSNFPTQTVYAFNPNGTVAWTKAITVVGGTDANSSPISIGADGTLYFGTAVYGPGNDYLNIGKLYALDSADRGTVKWTYDTGDMNLTMPPLIDATGTIYAGNLINPRDHEIKLTAIYTTGVLAGTKKWEKSFGTGDIGVASLALRDDGKLWLLERANWSDGSKIYLIDTTDGSTVLSDPGPSKIGNSGYGNLLLSDGVNGLYDVVNAYSAPASSKMNYYDASHQLKWQIPYAYDTNGGLDSYILAQPTINDNGWLYSFLSKTSYDNTNDYNDVPLQEFVQPFALAPWTLTPSTNAASYFRGNTVNFSVTTSMQQTNPLTAEANKMQVVLEDNTKVPLAYSSTNGDGDTVWTGTYTIPADAVWGDYSYAVQANAALVKTDIVTAFASPATGTDNTGLTATGYFTIARSGTNPGGSSGGGGSVSNPSINVRTPATGATVNADDIVGLDWTPANGAFTKYKVSYSDNNGTTWTSLSDNVTTNTLSWTAPDLGTTKGLIKVEGYDHNGSLLATGTSGNFTVIGEAVPDEDNGTSPALDPTVTGAYNANEAKENNPSFNANIGLTAPPAGTTVYCTAGELIKASLPSVYYCGADGKRYVFVNDKAFFSWYPDFSTVLTISDDDLAKIPLGGNITYRPGSRMIKIQSDPKVYAVARGGILRWITTEAIALRLYGTAWNQMIDDVPDSFFVNYTVGDPITE